MTDSTTVILVRHAETPQHAENRYVGRTDVSLTDAGRDQAETLAGWAKRADLTGIWCSPLRRCKETAAPSVEATGLSVRYDDRLVELDFGEAELLTSKEMHEAFPEARKAFEADPYRNPLPGGEDPARAIERVCAALDEIGNGESGSKVLVVAHGTLIRLAVCELFGIDPGRYRNVFPAVANTSGAVLRNDPKRGWGLLRWNPVLDGTSRPCP